VDAPPTGAKSNGVYIRRFEHGMAIVNPKGNGPQNVNLSTLYPGETYKHVLGSRDPKNDGTTVSTISLADRDGLILVKVP